MTGKWAKAENHHNDSTYRRHRDIIRRRDAYCVRCYVLHGLITPARDCDHHVNLMKGGSHDLHNLWMLCTDCHLNKTNNEKNGRSGFTPETDWSTGWDIEEPDWAEVIRQRHDDWVNRQGT